MKGQDMLNHEANVNVPPDKPTDYTNPLDICHDGMNAEAEAYKKVKAAIGDEDKVSQ